MVELELEFMMVRGPAYSKESPGIPYFIGVTDFSNNVVLKEKFTTKSNLSKGKKTLSWKEKLTQRIPLDPGMDGGDYAVYIGLQLAHSELDYNRQRYGR